MKGRAKLSLFLSFFIICIQLSAQTFKGDLVITTQAQIDSFNYAEIIGSLSIQESEPGNITNLYGLRTLKQINLERITGMGYYVGSNLSIYGNSALKNLDGLENLTLAKHIINISNNTALENIDALKKIGGALRIYITGNPSLKNVDGLSGISLLRILDIKDNASLTDVNGLSNVTKLTDSDYDYFTSSLDISGNPALENVNGLLNVTSAQDIYIYNNASLKNVDGLSSLETAWQLSINNNGELTDVDGLFNLSHALLSVYENRNLSKFCGIFNLIAGDSTYLTDTTKLHIHSNAYNPTPREILDQGPCDGGSFVKILSYSGGGDLREGSEVVLNWESNVTALVLQYRFTDTSEWMPISDVISADSQYLWSLPLVDSAREIILKYSDKSNPELYDTSDALTIRNIILTLQNPQGGRIFIPGQTINITWSSIYAEKFRLEYSVNGGGSWSFIADNLSDSTFQWVTPDVISDHVKIKLTEAGLPAVYTESGEFSITTDCSYKAIKFTGSDEERVLINQTYLTLGYASTKQLTLAAWVKIDSTGREMSVISCGYGKGGATFWLKISDTKIKFGYYHGAADNQSGSEVTADAEIIPGKWYHIAGVRNGKLNQLTMKLYLNGTLLDSAGTSFQGGDYTSEPITIGAGKDFYGQYEKSFYGAISEVQMYKIPLFSNQIRDKMFRELDHRDTTNLIGYWKLNGDVKDYSNVHNDGELQGNPAWVCDHPFLSDEEPLSAWKIQIKGKVKDRSDDDNYAGVSDDAVDGYDLSDVPETPAEPGSYIRVYFPHPEWNNKLARDFMHDIRANVKLENAVKLWVFEVQSNVKDTISLTFDKYELPENAKTYFSDLSKAERNLNLPSEYRYYNASSEMKRFMLIVTDLDLEYYLAPVVQLIQPNGGEIWKSNSEEIIKWKVPDQNKIDSIFIYTVKNEGNPHLIKRAGGSEDQFTLQTPNEYWNNNYKIKVEVKDTSGHIGKDLSDGTFTIVGDSLAKTSKSGFSLISIPLLIIDSSKASIFEDDYPNASYFIYSYSGTGGYIMPDYLRSGTGYWLTLVSEKKWDVKGEVLTDENTSIDLKRGYNLIGNKYVRELRKSRDLSFRYAGSVYSFDEAVRAELITTNLFGTAGRYYFNTDLLVPFEGYWLGVLMQGVQLVQHLPLLKKAVEEVTDTLLNASNWQMNISVNSPGFSDSDNVFGIRADATSEFDAKYDSPEPPVIPSAEGINLWFNMPGNKYSEIFGNKFSREFKSTDDINFNFNVESGISREITIIWDNSLIRNVPGLGLVLMDKADNKLINMLESGQYSFLNSGSREFMIKGSILTDVNESDIPESYYLTQNYPNPFNPSTKIEYGLPEKSFVSVSVYDITGSEVQLLVNEEKPAGKYLIEWKPQTLASGLYLCRITAGNYTFVRKMIFLK